MSVRSTQFELGSEFTSFHYNATTIQWMNVCIEMNRDKWENK